jgi:2-aminoethylphosphonate transport system substrate-binding protein
MYSKRIFAITLGGVLALSGCAASPGAAASSGTTGNFGSVTVYSADGLHDGTPSWYQTEFAAFTKQTGIEVNYVEAGSAEVVSRADKEESHPQADVLVTLPPFIQNAASEGLLQAYVPKGANQINASLKDAGGKWYAVVNNYASFIYNSKELAAPPNNMNDLLDAQFKNKLQYSTPGQAGDGTAVLINTIHMLGSTDAAMAYFKKLQGNNVGPSSSTGKLTTKVNHGDLMVANGDVQMNYAQQATNPNIQIFFAADSAGKKTTFALPYCMGLVAGAPDSANGKKLMDFLLSDSAQTNVSSIGGGFSVRSDITADDAVGIKLKALMAGVTIWQPDWNTISQDMPQMVQQWQQATGS